MSRFDDTQVERLERKLEITRQIRDIKKYFAESRCPVCGSQSIEENIQIIGSEAMSHGEASVKCAECGMFNYKRHINGYESYHWNHDGSSELNMLKELKSSTFKYLK